MKKNILKTIALALSIGSLGSIQAMNEPTSSDQSYAQTIAHYIKNYGTYLAGLTIAGIGSGIAHTGGHTLMASIEWDSANTSPTSRRTVNAAGTATGILFSYAGAKGLQLLSEYHKTNDLEQAVTRVQQMPLGFKNSDSPFLHGLQDGLTGSIVNNIFQLVALEKEPDGPTKWLGETLSTDNSQDIPAAVVITWNTALAVGTVGYTLYCANDNDAAKKHKEIEPKKQAEKAKRAPDVLDIFAIL